VSKVQQLLDLLEDISKPCKPGDKRKKCKKDRWWWGPIRGIGFPGGRNCAGRGQGGHDSGHHGGPGPMAGSPPSGPGGSPGGGPSGGPGAGSGGGSAGGAGGH